MTLCADWIEASDVDSCGVDTSGYDAGLVASALTAASEWTYNASGKRWSGVCETVERPCGCGCGCVAFGDPWTSQAWVDYYGGFGGGDYGLCSCGSLSLLETTFGPIVGTPTVTIGGAPFTGFTVVAPNRLLRTDGDAWPSCQDYTSAATGTIITYQHGAAPPELGVFAAAALAAEIIKACSNEACSLPPGTTAVSRRNVTLTLDPEQAAANLSKVAMFLNAYPPQISPPDVRRPQRRGLITSTGTP